MNQVLDTVIFASPGLPDARTDQHAVEKAPDGESRRDAKSNCQS